ncbi:hypothetical protein GCM10023096_45350 [Nonomuraea ferruginea]
MNGLLWDARAVDAEAAWGNSVAARVTTNAMIIGRVGLPVAGMRTSRKKGGEGGSLWPRNVIGKISLKVVFINP